MRRLVLVLLVACLGFQAGVLTLACGDPCQLSTGTSAPDGDCPPLCTTCGCCTMAASLALFLPQATAPRDAQSAVSLLPPAGPRAGRPADIWHVPLAPPLVFG